MDIKIAVLDYIKRKQLNWDDYVRKMKEERLSRNIVEWCSPERSYGNSWSESQGNEQHGMGFQGRVEEEIEI